jgi:citrate synthase
MADTRRPTTALCRYTNDAVFVRGVNLVEELIGKVSFTEMIVFHLIGRRPTQAEVNVLDAVLVTLMEHGLTPSAIATRMIALSSPEAMQAAVAAGILGVGSQFIGTIEDSAALLGELVEAPEGVRARAETVVRRHFAERRHLPGFGHHLHRPDDPRSPKLIAVARENGIAGRHVEALLVLAEVVDAVAGRHITINATGAVGAVLADLGIPRDVVRGIAVISRAAGLVGHIREEREDPAARFIWELAEKNVDKRGSTEGAAS